jgi:hypothetical protein
MRAELQISFKQILLRLHLSRKRYMAKVFFSFFFLKLYINLHFARAGS